MKKTGLGRGLDVLLPQNETIFETVIQDIDVTDIEPSKTQPRRKFDEEAMEQLAGSIRQSGILSPLLVVKQGSMFRIVAGERRYRAAKMAGLSSVPCIVRGMTTVEQMEATLIENLQREDLNAIEEATAIHCLMKECGYTQEEIANRLGKSRPAVANLLRLLTLPEEIMNMVITQELSVGHAKVLAGISSVSRQIELAHQCVLHDYSVRKLEGMAQKADVQRETAPAPESSRSLSAELAALQNTIRKALGVKATLMGNEKKGKILLAYSSVEELNHIFEVIGRLDP